MPSDKTNKKILIYGYFGYHSNRLDGQNVKTRDIYRLLCQKTGADNLDFFDTEDIRRNPFTQFRLFHKVCHCRQLIYLPAEHNLCLHFPILFFLSRIFHFEILYIVIGGWLVETLERHPSLKANLKEIKGIYTETQLMKNLLETRYQFTNVHTFPNFRMETLQRPDPSIHSPLRLVFMARIRQEKGIDWIAQLGDFLISHSYNEQVQIDFYGFVLERDQDYFDALLKRFPFMHYKGQLSPKDILPTLSQYDLLLLPTHYYTEGLPGSVLDAYSAGIPVIVSNWKHATEFVDDGITGYIIPFENGCDDLNHTIEQLIHHPESLTLLKHNAFLKSQSFTAESAWNILAPNLI